MRLIALRIGMMVLDGCVTSLVHRSWLVDSDTHVAKAFQDARHPPVHNSHTVTRLDRCALEFWSSSRCECIVHVTATSAAGQRHTCILDPRNGRHHVRAEGTLHQGRRTFLLGSSATPHS